MPTCTDSWRSGCVLVTDYQLDLSDQGSLTMCWPILQTMLVNPMNQSHATSLQWTEQVCILATAQTSCHMLTQLMATDCAVRAAGHTAQQPTGGKTMRLADIEGRAFDCHIPYLQNTSRDAEPPSRGFKVCNRHSRSRHNGTIDADLAVRVKGCISAGASADVSAETDADAAARQNG